MTCSYEESHYFLPSCFTNKYTNTQIHEYMNSEQTIQNTLKPTMLYYQIWLAYVE